MPLNQMTLKQVAEEQVVQPQEQQALKVAEEQMVQPQELQALKLVEEQMVQPQELVVQLTMIQADL